MLNKKENSINLTLTPEQSIELMKEASNTFYRLAANTQCHPFLEFTGIINEYIKICEENYKLRGIDFREENIHTGRNQMVIPDYMVDYINEKLECIFQGLIVVKRGKTDMTKYINLLEDFLADRITTSEFEQQFLQLFKSDKSFDSEREFQILDKLFGNVDAYCGDSDLFDPEFDIDEAQLKTSAKEALEVLKKV